MPTVTSIKRRKTVSLIAAMLIVLSAVGALLPAVISGDNGDDETKIWGLVVEDTAGVSIKKATVYLYNVHTGEKFSYELQNDGYFEFIGNNGYFILEVVPKDVTSPVKEAYLTTDQSLTEIFLVEKGDTKGPYYNFEGVTNPDYLTLEKVPPAPRETFTVDGYIKDEFENPVDDAVVTLKSTEYPGLEVDFQTIMSTETNITGYYEITAFNSTYEIWATALGYTYSTMGITLNMSQRDKNITLKSPEYIITGQALDKDGEQITNVNVFLFDENSDEYIHKQSPISFFNIKVYKGTFKLVVDADGYKPYIHDTDIVITDANKGYTIPAFTMDKSSEENVMTEITFPDGDFNKTLIKTSWTLNADSDLHGLEWVDVGCPRYQIDKQFGNADLNVDASEMVDFNNWLKSRGPYRLYTEDFFEVNDTSYDPSLPTFKSTPSGFTGMVVGSMGSMKITTELTYTHPDGISDWAYKVLVGEFRDNEKIKITFPSEFEITSKFDEDIATLDNFHTININYSETPVTIKLSKVKGPVAVIDYKTNDYVTTLVDVSFDAGDSSDPIGEIVNYTWDFADGSIAYDEEVTHNWTASGIKNVTLTIKDSSDLVDTDYKIITVDDKDPVPVIEFQNKTGVIMTEADEDEPITFNATKSTDTIDGTEKGEIVQYLWDFGDEESGQSNQMVTEHSYSKPGTYDIILNLTDAAGNYKDKEIALTIKDITKPNPDMNPNSGQIEVGRNFTLSAEGTTDNFDGIDNLTFYWDTDVNTDEDGDGIKDNDYDPDQHGPIYNYSTDNYHAPRTMLVNVTDQAGNWRNITGYFTVKGIDLKLQENKIKVSPSSKVEVDKKVKIEVNVTNKGVDAENIIVTFYVDGSEKGRKEIEFIEEDGSETVTFSWKAKGEDKTHTLKINITMENANAEEFWQDNEYEHRIKVIPGEIDPLCYVVVVVAVVIVVAILIYRKRTYGTFDIRPRKKGGGGKKKKKKGKDKEKSKKK